MGSAITFKVAAAFGIGALTTPAPGDWVDLTPYWRNAPITRGRDHELNRMQAGVSTIALRNTDRRFDPDNAGGPYYPNLVPMTQVRVQAVLSAVTYDLFQGFTEDWGQTWPPRPISGSGDAQCNLRCVDGFKLLSLANVKSYSTLVAEDGPVGWWPLDDDGADGTIADLGSAGATGTIVGVPRLRRPDEFGALRAMEFANGDASSIDLSSAPQALRILGDLTLEFWINPTNVGRGAVIETCANEGSTNGFPYRAGVESTGPNGGKLLYKHASWGNVVGPIYGTSVLSGWTHCAVVRIGRTINLYVDGVLETSSAFTIPPGYQEFSMALGNETALLLDGGGAQIRHPQVYDYALDPARIAQKAAVQFDILPSGRIDTQIGAILNAVGWPAGRRSLDASTSTAQEWDPTGAALDAIQRLAEDTERGLFFARGDGVLRFVSRGSIAAAYTVAATFGDSGAELAYADLGVRNDDQDLHNDITVSRDGGAPQVSSDAAKIAHDGDRVLDVSTLLADDVQTDALADGLLALYKTFASRVETMSLEPTLDTISTQMLGQSEPDGTRVTIVRRPPGGGAAISKTAMIEGIEHQIDGPRAITTKWKLVPAVSPQPWILGDATYSVLGSTTIPGY
jgi:hypothetical protein